MRVKQEIAELLIRALREVFNDAGWSAEALSSFEIPREEKFGDLATNLLLKVAKERRQNPLSLAREAAQQFEHLLKGTPLERCLSKVCVEPPGFINFFYSPLEYAQVVRKIHEEKERFGRPSVFQKRKILLEFVSANPTGPLTVAHGRQAAIGDSLARIFRFLGHEVATEYYTNDQGVQIDLLGESTYARVLEREVPENGYRGDYLVETAQKLKQIVRENRIPFGRDSKKDAQFCAEFAAQDILEGIQKDLSDFRVAFDHYYSEAKLRRSGKIEEALQRFREKNLVYAKDGALWFRSTDFGDDKDRVLLKSDQTYTYLAPDAAYHHEKFERGFGQLINIWGPDHHGYISRLKASQAALGHDPECIRILIAQLVTLCEGKTKSRMSTRAGEFVTLRQILEEVGVDAARFFFLMRKLDAHLDFDLALARSQTPENPVFYLQYVHARVESLRKMYEDKKGKWERPIQSDSLLLLKDPYETRLLRLLCQYEEVLLAADRTLEPYRLVPYLLDLAAAFHKFYTEDRVILADSALTQARMMLSLAVQSVIRSGLGLLGVSAPLKM